MKKILPQHKILCLELEFKPLFCVRQACICYYFMCSFVVFLMKTKPVFALS